MGDSDWLAAVFEEHRGHLRAVAYRLLGSVSDADDAVQDTWLRLTGTDARAVENLCGWLTTVVARISLNMLRSRRRRHEEPVGDSWPGDAELAAWTGPATGTGGAGPSGPAGDPADEAVLADSVGLALLVVLDTLTPAERLAFVLHDLFAMPFTDVAAVLGRSVTATRQLASRARRRVCGAPTPDQAGLARQREVATAFPVYLVLLEIKIRVEEKLMLAEFPGDYPRYRQRLPQLIPGLRVGRKRRLASGYPASGSRAAA